MSDYNFIQNDRGLINLDTNKDTKGGEVAILVHKSISFVPIARSIVCGIGETEFLIIKVNELSSKASVLIVCVYRPPRGHSYDSFFEVLLRNRQRAGSIIVLGDSNAHLERNCPDAVDLRSLATSAGLHTVQTGTSFHETHKHS